MEIGNSSAIQGLWDLTSVKEVDNSRRYKTVQAQTTHSGDTIEISDEARELYSKMIHKYDHSSSDSGEGQAAQSGGGGQSLDSSENSTDKIKNQIQSLKSQLAALASRAGSGDGAAMSKMSALEAEIAALEAQLNEAVA